MWNSSFDRLSEFPFRRLAALLASTEPAAMPIVDLSIGEPKHAPPSMLMDVVSNNADLWNRYPPPTGTDEYRQSAADWLRWRFSLPEDAVDPNRNILPLAGTKEGLFFLANLARKDGNARPSILMPNPLYAVYLGAAALANAEAVLLPATKVTGFLPDLATIDHDILQRTDAFYLCSPGNPQGAVATLDYLKTAITMAREFDFLLIVDECYSEIYDRQAPHSALEAAIQLDRSFDRVVVLHSLSKRSNAAGLRSGFIAGDAEFLASFARMRAYGAAVQPMPLMAAGAALWRDEEHVVRNRDLYRRKIDLAEARLGHRYGFYRPAGGFFLWLDVDDGERFTLEAWRRAALKLLPGSYLSGPSAGGEDPGHNYVRVALVHDEEIIGDALERLISVMEGLTIA